MYVKRYHEPINYLFDCFDMTTRVVLLACMNTGFHSSAHMHVHRADTHYRRVIKKTLPVFVLETEQYNAS